MAPCAPDPARTPPFPFKTPLFDSASSPASQEGWITAQAPVHARTHTEDGEPVIWQLKPENLQKIGDEVFTRAAELASKERKKDLKALQAVLGDMQHAVEQMRARVQSLDDPMVRLGNDVAAQRAVLEELVSTTRETDGGLSLGVNSSRGGQPTAANGPRRTPLAQFETFLRTCPPERISAGYANWDFDRAMHAIADAWALDPEQLRATLTLWREHRLIATDGPDTCRARLRTGRGTAAYALCVPIASHPLVGIETPPAPRAVSAGSKE